MAARRVGDGVGDLVDLRPRQVVEEGDVRVEVVALGREVRAAQGVEAPREGRGEPRAPEPRGGVGLTQRRGPARRGRPRARRG